MFARVSRSLCSNLLRKKDAKIGKRFLTLKSDQIRNKRIVSGMQPTGDVHLGNYLGAIVNWVELQNNRPGNVLFTIVDLHSLTVEPDAESLTKATWDVAAALLASGIDPSKSTLFLQSRVPEHSELQWLLNCMTPMGRLTTMIQYKEKIKQRGEAFAGILNYPVLMAADVLLYKGEQVPVGEDQSQHLELMRFLAEKFNGKYKKDFFPVPETLFTPTKRVMSLKDGTKKMSKSDRSEYSKLLLTDSVDMIHEKLLRAKTDSIMGVTYDATNRPEVANLLTIFSVLSGRSIEDICQQFADKDMLVFKKALLDVLVEKIVPIGKKIEEYQKDKPYMLKVLNEGSDKARDIASQTLREALDRIAVGLHGNQICGTAHTWDLTPVGQALMKQDSPVTDVDIVCFETAASGQEVLLAGAAHSPKVERLCISSMLMRGDEASYSRHYGKVLAIAKTLKTFALHRIHHLKVDALLAGLNACTSLQTLVLEHCELTDADFEKLVAVICNPNSPLKLKVLNIQGNQITDASAPWVQFLLERSSLEAINFQEIESMKEEFGPYLGRGLAKNKTVKRLHFVKTKLGARGAASMFQEIKGVNETLEVLNFDMCKIGKQGGDALVDFLRKNASIQNVHVGSAGIAEKTWPNLLKVIEDKSNIISFTINDCDERIGDISVRDLIKKSAKLSDIRGKVSVCSNKDEFRK